jgi:hypothetical protein
MLTRGDASKKKRFDLAQERCHDLPEFLVMRRDFERGVDQQATQPLFVVQGSFDDFLQERDDRIPRGKAVLKTPDALAEGLVEIAIERALEEGSLVAESPGAAKVWSACARTTSPTTRLRSCRRAGGCFRR